MILLNVFPHESDMAFQNVFLALSSFWMIFLCVKGNGRIDVVKRELNQVSFRHQRRYRRWSTGSDVDHDCYPNNTIPGFKGHLPLTKDKVNVTFLRFSSTYYVARVTWDMPKVKNVPPADSTTIVLFRSLTIISCIVVKNKKSIDIGPSSGWKAKERLQMMIVPLPMQPKYQALTLDFQPHFVRVTQLPSQTRYTSPSDDKNISKIVIGSVAGVAVGIVLIVILIIRHLTGQGGGTPPPCEDFYYVSCCHESKAVMKKVEEFVWWSRQKSFDVQMDTMLSPSNELRRREIGPFSFGEVILRKAKNVFIMVSPAYLRLCQMDQHETRQANIDNLSQEEKRVYYEIVHIRNDLCLSMFRGDRFIPILVGVKETQLPFWMKELVLYSWPEDATRLLYRLHNVPEYAPVQNNVFL